MLALIVPYYNFCQYASRKRNYDRFMAHMANFPVRVITVECAIGSQDFQVTQVGHADHLQVRAEHPLWFKENLIGLGCRYAAQTQPDVTAYGWIDADLEFQNPQWVQDTREALKSYSAIQPFETVVYLDKQSTPEREPRFSYGAWYAKNRSYPQPGNNTVPGGAWIIRRDAFERLGGLLECHIVGGGDSYMAQAFIGEVKSHNIFTPAGEAFLKQWMDHASNTIQGRVGHINGTILHHHHGNLDGRQYGTRAVQNLSRFAYDPTHDLIHNADGVIQLTSDRSDMQEAITSYFRSRNEDD